MIKEGSRVKWKWGDGYAEGKVVESFTRSVTRTLKGNEITRNGEEGNKALLIRQSDGDEVLKLENEVDKVQ